MVLLSSVVPLNFELCNSTTIIMLSAYKFILNHIINRLCLYLIRVVFYISATGVITNIRIYNLRNKCKQ